MDTVIPLLSILTALLFVGFLTIDTFKSIKTVLKSPNAFEEEREMAKTLGMMWVATLGFGVLIMTGIVNLNAWISWV